VLLEDGFPLKEYLKKRRAYARRTRVFAMIEMAEAVRAGTMAVRSPAGARFYDAWRHTTLQSLDEKSEQDMTVFEKIKNGQKSVTLFDRLRKKRKKEST
jgi:hypothetical protein